MPNRDSAALVPARRAATVGTMSLAAVAAWSTTAHAQFEVDDLDENVFRSGAWTAEVGANGRGITSWSNNSGGPDHAQNLTYFVGVTEAGDAQEDIYRLTGGSGTGASGFSRPGNDESRLLATYGFFIDGNGYDNERLFDLDVEYQIRGSNNDGSVISEQVSIRPSGASRGFDLRLFAYDDYDLDGDRFGDVGQRTTGATSYRQLNQAGTFVDTTARALGASAASTFYFNQIQDGTGGDLDRSLFNALDFDGVDPAAAGFQVNGPVVVGPGDVEHAYAFGTFSYGAGVTGFSDLIATTKRKGFFADVVLPSNDDDGNDDPPGPGFRFRQDNPNVKGQPPRWYDPIVAVGYDYVITEGADGNGFADLTLSSGFLDGQYFLTITDEDHPLFNQTFAVVGDNVRVSFDFTLGNADGVDSFRITGIEPNAMIDPEDEMGFPTGLTFVNSNGIAFTQTPITFDTDVIPEPASLALLGLGGVAMLRRRRD